MPKPKNCPKCNAIFFGKAKFCKECSLENRRIYKKLYRKNNSEKIRISDRHYRQTHKEKCNKLGAAWRKANPEKASASIVAWKKANPEKVKASKKAYNEKHIGSRKIYNKNNKEKIAAASKKWRENNKEKIKAWRKANLEKAKAWEKANPEKVRTARKRYYEKHKEALKLKRKNYNAAWNKKYHSNSKFKLNHNISRAIRNSLKNGKNGKSWTELVDYSVSSLKKHLEKKFTKGMTWELYLEGKIHIDHKVPISVFNFTKPEHEDFKRCWALSNLQPLWAKDNLEKNATITKHFQPSLLL